ncbi:hypothetical protein CLOACE_14120 [Clostridium acetireducens DSM 10703]|jgi:hypothetical protein|uniref:Uncharacterized protein n=1 Tax=Clostridium acetireducens DSM 10703 TaxID=1121290 RepID=A0A1E8EYB0_9CLOT|nr:hypothetical protein [Clostridium acetireducens]OFI05937.1 hypothetical protein CLOACE_14120 [Clostridium acetireducens DSM 10703]
MLREYVSGEKIKDYIKRKGLSKKLALNLIELIEEFKRLKFKKLDMRGEHIFIQKDESVKVIDPRKSFSKKVPIPYSLIKAIDKAGALEDFIRILINYRPDLLIKWKRALTR